MSGEAGQARNHDRSLDALRGLAALLVLLSHIHILDPRSPTVGLGDWVLLFFPLSGYLVAGPFIRALVDGTPLPSTRRYALRRIARIVPAYWLVLLTIAVVLPYHAGTHWWQLPLHLSLLHNLVPGEMSMLLPVGWSLGIEALFYVSVPLVARAVRRRVRGAVSPGAMAAGIVALFAASALWDAALFAVPAGALSKPMVNLLQFSLPGYLLAFCPGMLVALAETSAARASRARLWAGYRRLQARPLVALLLMGLLAIQMLPGIGARLPVSRMVGSDLYLIGGSLAAGMVLLMVRRPGRVVLAGAAVLAPLGTVSYGVYLWHGVVVDLLRLHARWLLQWGWVGDTVVVLGASLVLATLSWVLLERPVIRWAATRRPRPVTTTTLPLPVEVAEAAA